MFPATLSAVARAATPAIAALVAAGIEHEVVAYQHDPRNESFGDEAVAQLAADGVTTTPDDALAVAARLPISVNRAMAGSGGDFTSVPGPSRASVSPGSRFAA